MPRRAPPSPPRYISGMSRPQSAAAPTGVAALLTDAVSRYRDDSDMAALQERLAAIVATAPLDELAAAAEPYRQIPEVAGPLYERIVEERADEGPQAAKDLVTLANAYWLAGRGPDLVGQVASRAIAADPANRAGWHMWALSESDQRARTQRWLQVVERFPEDDLARANAADNAAGVAGAEGDREALAIAIREFEYLRAKATRDDQRAALDTALKTLKGWTL